MEPLLSPPSQLFARDIVQYSDVELDQYLEATRRHVVVEDPENLTEEFIQRLRIRARPIDTDQSHAINLDDLTKRLENLPPSPLSPASTEVLDEEECYRLDLEEEKECYNTLVNEGGRPSHPISLGRDVVFRQQMAVWQAFRTYQQFTRTEGRFPRYNQRLRARLARYGFERPFQLEENLYRQDKLATWIEFLNYQYHDHGKYVRNVERLQPVFDKAWQVLVDAHILRPFETQEFICNPESAFQHTDEREQAKKAVESAELAVKSVQNAIADPSRSSLSQEEPRQLLAAAQSRLDEAIKSLELIERRNDLVNKFFVKTAISQLVDGKMTKTYQGEKSHAEHCEILIRWILKQIPLIELEINGANIAKQFSTGVRGGRGRKRNRDFELDKGHLSSGQRQHGEKTQTSPRGTRVSNTKDQESKIKCSRDDSFNKGRPSKRPKYNGSSDILSLDRTFQAADSTSIIQASPTHLPTSQNSAAQKTQTNAPLKPSEDEKSRVMKRKRRGGKFANRSTPASSLRRSTRRRRPPATFQ